ncbi:AI-2E family transporter [Gulosibacter chungangensis]|uniref:AI-2E family transporter n=1 Tax=Gulosibacter chungangensis TaxID=979746 RepID=A0A7J5BB33_9MICO|nr:AI-2E family transporter [Gulosibacter chungangensis]KAB1643256.1 AI-2E family transporter [Gulosibacter chungangensis]
MAGSTRAPRPETWADLETEADLVSRPIRVAAAWGWRVIVIVLAAIPVIWVIGKAAIVVVPLLVALLFTALLVPLTNMLHREYNWPKWLAMIAGLLVLFASIAALVLLVVLAFRSGQQFDVDDFMRRYREFLVWLESTPFQVSQDVLDNALAEVVAWVQANMTTLIQGTLSAGTTIAGVITGTVFTIFAVVFYLLDGRRIWLFFVSLFPRAVRAAVDGAGERAWISTGHYVRVQVVVALIDAVGIFLGALILQVPYALAIGIIVFLFAFVPLVGAFLSGALAVVLAFVANGFWNALIMLIIVVAVMAIESNLLQPLIMGPVMKLHPLAVLVSVSAGSLFAGIGGAVFAVPVVAAIKSMVKYISSGRWRGDPDPTAGLSDPDDDAMQVPARRPLVARRRRRKEPAA